MLRVVAGERHYHPVMPTAGSASSTHRDPRPPLVTRKTLLACLLAWGMVSLLQSLALQADMLKLAPGDARPYWMELRVHLLMHLPYALCSAFLYGALLRSRRPLNRPLNFLGTLLLWSPFIVAYQPYMVALSVADKKLPWSEFATKLAKHPLGYAFFDYLIFIGAFAFIYALVVFQRSLADERRRQRVEAENLALRLEVEQGRLAALRAQLEPHFLFNALNALSALVRGGEQLHALHAVQRLSELLRYAIAVSGKEWTSLGEEAGFVEDYLALQRLRFGTRLNVTLDAGDAGWREVDCPPLLLQPLVENALRHDLETGADASDIHIAFSRQGDRVGIRISNPVNDQGPGNGGTGIGLRNITSRLALVYGDRAAIHARREQDRFIVEVDLPVDAEAVAA
jgi:two-component system sensor histidine kinase AlgZ